MGVAPSVLVQGGCLETQGRTRALAEWKEVGKTCLIWGSALIAYAAIGPALYTVWLVIAWLLGISPTEPADYNP